MTALSLQQGLLAILLSLAGLAYAASFQRYRFALGWLVMLWLALGLGAQPIAQALGWPLAHDMAVVVSRWLPWNLLLLAVLPRIPLRSRAVLAIVVVLALQQALVLLAPPESLSAPGLLNSWASRLLPEVAAPWLIPVEPRILTVACLALFFRWQKRQFAAELFLFLAACALLMASLRPSLTYACFLIAAALLMLGVLLASHAMAFVDPLTRLKNRRALDNALKTLSGNYAIGMLDIDHFKKVNDRFGHEFGDHVLRMVAGRVRDLRLCQTFRYGGEEFCLLFKQRTLADAKKRADEIREAIAARPVAMRAPGRPRRRPISRERHKHKVPSVKATVSIGLAHASKHSGDPEAVIEAADKALYRAKRAGRNRVAVER
ncbi:MAG: GGDEF domain-containing protein [Pseudomonadota bacterium]